MFEDNPSAQPPFIETLTPRERGILSLLSDFSLTTADIAARLTLAPSSVKWYTRQIYAKLEVNNRRQAVTRAGALGLLAPGPLAPQLGGSQNGNLPAVLTPFIGRENAVNQICQMLADPNIRLVTLTGPGGVGKTRLGLKAAEAARYRYPNGCWLVELESLADGRHISETAAAVFGTLRGKERGPLPALKEFLKNKKTLLVLDNCEHLPDFCAEFTGSLLLACSGLQILATSRAPLGITGEFVFSVPSLSFPDPRHLPDLAGFGQFEAPRLFIERAKAFQQGFAVTEKNREAIARICQKLDGLPLALELAAARLNVLPVEQIADNLEESFQLLSGGSRSALPRQRTLRASMDWSYSLLNQAEQAMLRRLSVFAGGWTLAALETTSVGADAAASAIFSEETTIQDSVDLLSNLIDHSLVINSFLKYPQDESVNSDVPHYHMLEPIRQYALEKLVEAGEESGARGRHLAYYLALAESAEKNLRGREQALWLDLLEKEIDNFRTSLEWAQRTNPTAQLRMTLALMWFWQIRGRWPEGLEWIMKGLDALAASLRVEQPGFPLTWSETESYLRARALSAAGYLQSNSLISQDSDKEYEKAAILLKESLALYRKQPPRKRGGMAFPYLQLARCGVNYASPSQVITWANLSLALYKEQADLLGISECLLVLAENEWNTARASEAFEEALRIKTQIGDVNGLAQTYASFGDLAVFEGEYEKAGHYILKSLEQYRQAGNESSARKALRDLGWTHWVRGDPVQALETVGEALALCQDANDLPSFAGYSLLRGKIRLSQGQVDLAWKDADAALRVGAETSARSLTAGGLILAAKLDEAEGKREMALGRQREALGLAREINSQRIIADALSLFGELAGAGDDPEAGKPALIESLKIYYELHFWHHWIEMAYPLLALGNIALKQNEFQQAASLYGIATRLFPALPKTLSPVERQRQEEYQEFTRIRLGEEVFLKFWQEGFSMAAGQMADYMMAHY